MPLQDTAAWRIGEAARRSGVSAANIRFYEKEKLLPPGARADNRYRLYSAADVHRLRFIRLCRAMDMSLGEVRTLVALNAQPPTDTHAACHTLDEHLAHVRARRKELQALEQDLRALRSRCDGTDDAHCHVLDALHAQLLAVGGHTGDLEFVEPTRSPMQHPTQGRQERRRSGMYRRNAWGAWSFKRPRRPNAAACKAICPKSKTLVHQCTQPLLHDTSLPPPAHRPCSAHPDVGPELAGDEARAARDQSALFSGADHGSRRADAGGVFR